MRLYRKELDVEFCKFEINSNQNELKITPLRINTVPSTLKGANQYLDVTQFFKSSFLVARFSTRVIRNVVEPILIRHKILEIATSIFIVSISRCTLVKSLM